MTTFHVYVTDGTPAGQGGTKIEAPDAAAALHTIAAAPDMLAALRLCRDALGGGHLPGNTSTGDKALAGAIAAIAKAEGR